MGMKVLVTGGLGFIGSNFIRRALAETKDEIVNLDAETYAGNPENLADLLPHPRYRFLRGDISDPETVRQAMEGVQAVAHFAAETHVDRSILDPEAFLKTNVLGTHVLLEEARRRAGEIKRFLHISTDEVYGPVLRGKSSEDAPFRPTSPYAASKAAADHLATAYHKTYGLPVVIARPSNNFGPYQYPEKALPLMITNWSEGKPFPLYGDGGQVRNWIYVHDCVRALDLILRKGSPGRSYNVGGSVLLRNRDLVLKMRKVMGIPKSLVRQVPDRPGHDRRYALDSRALSKLGYRPASDPASDFDRALRETAAWYQSRRSWWRPLKQSPVFSAYYREQYAEKTKEAAAR